MKLQRSTVFSIITIFSVVTHGLSACAEEVPKSHQDIVANGIYIAPVYGTSIEVIQVLDNLIALSPLQHLENKSFQSGHAALIGDLLVEGNSLTARWNDGTIRSGTFKTEGDCFSWGYIYCKAAPFSQGEKLDGRYIASATTPKGVISSTLDITFNADGTYTLIGVGTIGDPEVITRSVAGDFEKGKYEISLWTLILSPSSGTTRTYLSFPYDIWGKNDPIYINGGLARKR